MKYYKFRDDDDEVGMVDAITYVETETGVHIRQITTNGRLYLASNIVQSDGIMYLPDKAIDYDSIGDEVAPISREEFDAIWQSYLATRQEQWNQVKRTYTVGKYVEGFLELFYPQGVIVNLGNNDLGIADFVACRASTKPQFMYPRHKITAVVSGYDEENQWVVLDSPQVHPEHA
jgi:hypothetical protein